MMRAVRRLLLALLASLGLFGLSSCSPDPYPGEEGAVLHMSLRGLAKSLDPPVIGVEYSNRIASQVYEGLLAYHPYARPFQLMPALAEDMPSVSEDGMVYTFRIRKGVRFHDDPCFEGGTGREVTAHDFVFSLKRLGHPKARSTGWWLFEGKVAGFDAWREKLIADIEAAETEGETVDTLWGLDRALPGIVALDDHTLQITLAEPYPQFLWTLAMNYAVVYPREAIEFHGKDFRNHPVGTGPFQVVEYNPVYRVLMEKNPHYWDNRVPDPANVPADRLEGWDWQADIDEGRLTHPGERLPLIDGIEMRFILEDQPRWLYFKSGHTDWLIPPKDNSAEAIQGKELTPLMASRNVRLTAIAEMGTVYTALNTDDEVMANVNLRRALALAIDHNWTVDNLYSGNAQVAESLIPPGIAGYEHGYHPYKTADYSADIARAKELMVEAGYPEGIDPKTGKPLRLRFENSGTSTTQRHFAERVRDEFRRIGIEVDIIVNTWPQMNEKMRNRDYQMAGLAWGFDYPDAQNILQLLYGPNQAPGINRSNYDNPEFNALYEQSNTMSDGPERTAMYQKMARMVADDVPWIVRVHRTRNNLQQPWVTGAYYSEVHDQWVKYAALDVEMRERLVAEWNVPVRWPLGVFLLLFFGILGGSVVQARRTKGLQPKVAA